MKLEFVVEEDAEKPSAPTLSGWETVVFLVLDESDVGPSDLELAQELEAELVERYF